MKTLLQLNFLGITDIEFLYVAGLNTGETSKEMALIKTRLQLVESAA
jgi:FMN-dependent NADH-azoreductase